MRGRKRERKGVREWREKKRSERWGETEGVRDGGRRKEGEMEGGGDRRKE